MVDESVVLEMLVSELAVSVSELHQRLTRSIPGKASPMSREDVRGMVEALRKKQLVQVKELPKGEGVITITAAGVMAVENTHKEGVAKSIASHL
jgi:hypothetical protein